tara:strand:- start:1633 stop:1896 length:264 start_codon:yes stop_codon:yes gene_type:complete
MTELAETEHTKYMLYNHSDFLDVNDVLLGDIKKVHLEREEFPQQTKMLTVPVEHSLASIAISLSQIAESLYEFHTSGIAAYTKRLDD